MEPTTEKEKMLWKMAKKRVAFRRHLFTYIVVNGFLWVLWFFGTMGDQIPPQDQPNWKYHPGFPWPLWPMLGWGIGLAFNFYSAYFDNRADAVEREYEKLKNSGKKPQITLIALIS